MAEERLIDDDKDRKFRIKKNADGEDELVLVEGVADEENNEEIGFEVPEQDSDDEEAAVMTPEQLAAREKLREAEAEKRRKRMSEIVANAEKILAAGKFEDAVDALAEADGLGADDGALSALKIRALTRDFTDFSDCERGKEAVDELKACGGAEKLKGFEPLLPEINKKIEALREQTTALNTENEQKKGERRADFTRKRNKSLVFFAVTAVCLIVFAALAIHYGTHLTAVKGGANIPLFIAFISLAGMFFIAFLVAAKFFWKYAHNLRLNEKNSSTKLGRELEARRAELKFTESIAGILNDISR